MGNAADSKDHELLLEMTAVAAYLDRLRKQLQARVLGDKVDQVEQETAEWIHDDVATAPAEIPLLMDKGRVACETTLYTQTGKTLARLNDSGAQVNLVDKEQLGTWRGGHTLTQIPQAQTFSHITLPHSSQERSPALVSCHVIVMLLTCETPNTTNNQAPTRTAPPPPGWSKEVSGLLPSRQQTLPVNLPVTSTGYEFSLV
jgi:hypothetical protein